MKSNLTTERVIAHSPSRHQFQEGIFLLVAAMMILPCIDAIAKGLSGSIAPGQAAWSRFFFQVLILLPFALKSGSLRVNGALWLHAGRGFLIALATLLFFSAVSKMPMADVMAIFFVEPLILTLLSAFLLNESVGWRRIVAVFIGFCGALIIIRPSYEIFGLTALLPIGAATSFAFYLILTRWLVDKDNATTMQFYAGVFGCLTMSLGLWVGDLVGNPYLTPVLPTPNEWLFLALLGLIATVGHILIVMAIHRIGASLTAPFQYLEIISATLLGWIFFGDFPDTTTLVGVAIIIGSGLFVFLRERRAVIERESISVSVGE